MTKDIAKLQKENSELKSQVVEFGKELQDLKDKMAAYTSTETPREEQIQLSKSVEFFAKGYDEYETFKKLWESKVGKRTQKQSLTKLWSLRFNVVISIT